MQNSCEKESKVLKNIRKYESSTLAKSIFRPSHEIHPTQKSFSSSAIQSQISNLLPNNGGGNNVGTNDEQNTSSPATLELGSSCYKTPLLTNSPLTAVNNDTATSESPTGPQLAATAEFKDTLTNRISKGFIELTQGSSDRLQRWKSKLQSGKRHKELINGSSATSQGYAFSFTFSSRFLQSDFFRS
ncbi:unnamed protein product [Enterobius vermicularis]|uniref:PH domain-containing protein n=1 Tax=Enterobius vermicularis TaxID=51028 RepID=A0A0N4VQL3_ENTVE|nr:unnamed protein product [Enterobius vermicularis]